MIGIIAVWLLACEVGLNPLNNHCPGGPNCWWPSDTGHEEFPPLDENGNIICDDTGERDEKSTDY